MSDAPLVCALVTDYSPDEIGPIWRNLESRSNAGFFLSWHWMGAWLATLDVLPALLRVERHGEAVGLVFVTLEKVRWRGILRRRAANLNATGRPDQDVVTIEYNDILADQRWSGEIRQAAFDFLRGKVDRIVWRGVKVPLADTVTFGGWLCRDLARAPSTRIDLGELRRQGKSFLASLSTNSRWQIRRAIRLYEQRGPLRFERARTAEEGLAYFREMAPLHQARWTSRGKLGAFAQPFYVAMHERVIQTALPDGSVELIRVRFGDSVIGYLYNFCHRGHIGFYLGGIAYEVDNRLKPGLVTHSLCIQDHLESGAACYDFMAGDNRYKTSLGEAGPEIATRLAERWHPLLALEDTLRRRRQSF